MLIGTEKKFRLLLGCFRESSGQFFARLPALTYGVDVDEEAVLVLVRFEPVHVVPQLRVAVEEVGLGDEHGRACGTRRKVAEQLGAEPWNNHCILSILKKYAICT